RLHVVRHGRDAVRRAARQRRPCCAADRDRERPAGEGVLQPPAAGGRARTPDSKTVHRRPRRARAGAAPEPVRGGSRTPSHQSAQSLITNPTNPHSPIPTHLTMWSIDDWKYVARTQVADPKGRDWSVAVMDLLGQDGHPDMPNQCLDAVVRA